MKYEYAIYGTGRLSGRLFAHGLAPAEEISELAFHASDNGHSMIFEVV